MIPNNYRVIDLSCELVPGERKIDGRYLHGEPLNGRPIEVEEFLAYGARMHFIQGQTHTGTHAEGAYKYSETGADMATMPLDSYLGEAIVCNFSSKATRESVTSEDFRRIGVKPGDIVLAFTNKKMLNFPPLIDSEAIDWLISTKIKLLGTEFLDFSSGLDGDDSKLLLAGIPVIDGLCGLDQIRRPHVFFIALPIKLHRVTATWTRAVALEAIEAT